MGMTDKNVINIVEKVLDRLLTMILLFRLIKKDLKQFLLIQN